MSKTFSPDQLLTILADMPLPSVYWVAYSGGLDSQVLLYALAEVRGRLAGELRAIHIHHGLQPQADAWTAHCRTICQRLGVPLVVRELGLKAVPGKSLEAVAREARYQAIAAELGEGELLLTAHHQDDQAETVLLHLLRGSGPDGLAAMPLVMAWRKGHLARPLLDYTRQQLREYAERAGLEWIDDPSNRDTAFDRNYLRQEILPRLARRWPSYSSAFARSARHCGDARILIQDLAEIDLASPRGSSPDRISIRALNALSPARQRSLLRHWIRRGGFPVPDADQIERIMTEVASASKDRMPVLKWRDAELRRYRDDLLLLSPLLPPPDPATRLNWTGNEPLSLPAGLGQLLVSESLEGGIERQRWQEGCIHVGFRQGGERCRPCGQAHRRTLKNLFQELDIPPWIRNRTPLLFINGQLAAIPGYLVCHPFCAKPGSPAIEVRWTGL